MNGIGAIPFIYVRVDDISSAFSSVRRRRGVLVQLERFVCSPSSGQSRWLWEWSCPPVFQNHCVLGLVVLEVRSIDSEVEAESVIEKNVLRIMQ